MVSIQRDLLHTTTTTSSSSVEESVYHLIPVHSTDLNYLCEKMPEKIANGDSKQISIFRLHITHAEAYSVVAVAISLVHGEIRYPVVFVLY